jgi:hypothetical protein
VDPVPLWLLAFAPGFVFVCLGMLLSLMKAIRRQQTSRWGIRMSVLGFALVNIIPGVLLTIATIRGELLWPAAIAGLGLVAVGVGFIVVLRQNWAPRAAD